MLLHFPLVTCYPQKSNLPFTTRAYQPVVVQTSLYFIFQPNQEGNIFLFFVPQSKYSYIMPTDKIKTLNCEIFKFCFPRDYMSVEYDLFFTLLILITCLIIFMKIYICKKGQIIYILILVQLFMQLINNQNQKPKKNLILIDHHNRFFFLHIHGFKPAS